MASSPLVVDASAVVDGTDIKSASCLPPDDDGTYEIGPGCLLTTVFLRRYTGKKKQSQSRSPRRGRQSAEEEENEEDGGDDDDGDGDEEEEEEEANEEEAAALRALGLPVSFGTSKPFNKGSGRRASGARASNSPAPSPAPSPSPSPSPSVCASPARGMVSSPPPSSRKVKVSLCMYYERPQGCSKGGSCTFAHGEADRGRAQREKRAQAEQAAAAEPQPPKKAYWYPKVRRPRGADPTAYRPPYHGRPYSGDAMLGRYFSKRGWLWSDEIYDRGVRMDDEMWHSVTPFELARHHARRLLAPESSFSPSSSESENGSSAFKGGSRRGRGRLVLDGFAGVGGDAAALAFAGARVVAVDLSAPRLEAARGNAELFFLDDPSSSGDGDDGCGEHQKQKKPLQRGLLDVVAGDFFAVAPRLRVDCVFLSPPWGGPGYSGGGSSKSLFRARDDIGGLGVGVRALLAAAASAHAPAAPLDVAVFLPRSTFLPDLVEAAEELGVFLEVERAVEKGRGKAIGVTAYFGASARRKS